VFLKSKKMSAPMYKTQFQYLCQSVFLKCRCLRFRCTMEPTHDQCAIFHLSKFK